MKFSIITSVLNGARFLNETIRSVTAQTHRDLEYIIIDAGSDDGSLEMAQSAASNDDRISVYLRPHEPLYESLLWGLDNATGDFLSWLNADDLYTPWGLSVVSQHLANERGAQWLSGLPGCWDEEGRLRFVRPEGWRPQSLIRAGWYHKDLLGFIQQESVFFSRPLYASLTQTDRRNITSCSLAGDFALWKAFASRAPLKTIPSVLGGFRSHDDNQSVIGIERYMAEVRSAGGFFPPEPISNVIQYFFRAVSAVTAARLAMAADTYVNAVSESSQP